MQENFFRKQKNSNPFAKKSNNIVLPKNTKTNKRLNIIDMEVLNPTQKKQEIEFMETKMDNLYQQINKNPQNFNPVELEEMKIEWETLRDKLYQERKKSYTEGTKKEKNSFISIVGRSFSKLMTVFKIYSPKIKEIVNTFNEINKEVEELVKKSTPVGEEEMKYGLLVNKLYQASKLNGALTNEIK